MESPQQNQESSEDADVKTSESETTTTTTTTEQQRRRQHDLHMKARAHALGIPLELAKKQIEEIQKRKTEVKDNNHHDNNDNGGGGENNKNSRNENWKRYAHFVNKKPDGKVKYYANSFHRKETDDSLGPEQEQEQEQENEQEQAREQRHQKRRKVGAKNSQRDQIQQQQQQRRLRRKEKKLIEKKLEQQLLNQHSYLHANALEITEAKAQFEAFKIKKRKQKQNQDTAYFFLGDDDDGEYDNYNDDDMDERKYGGVDGEYDTDDEFYFYDENTVSDDNQDERDTEQVKGKEKGNIEQKKQPCADKGGNDNNFSDNCIDKDDSESSEQQQRKQQFEAEQELKDQKKEVRKRQEEVKDKKIQLSQQIDVIVQQRTELMELRDRILDQIEQMKQQHKEIKEQQEECQQQLGELRSHQQVLQLRERQQKEVHSQSLDVYRSVLPATFFDTIKENVAARKIQQRQEKGEGRSKKSCHVDTNDAASDKSNGQDSQDQKGKDNTKNSTMVNKRTRVCRNSINNKQHDEEEEGCINDDNRRLKQATKKRKLDSVNNGCDNQQTPDTAKQGRDGSAVPPNGKDKEKEEYDSSDEDETDDESIEGQAPRSLMERLMLYRQWRPKKNFKSHRHPLVRWLRRETFVRKREFGWLRKQEAALAGREIHTPGKKLWSIEEKKLAIECYGIIRSLPKRPGKLGYRPTKDLAHAFGVDRSAFSKLDKRYVLNGLDASRKPRSDTGETIINSEAKRKGWITPVMCYAKSREHQCRDRGDPVPPRKELNEEFHSLSDEAKLPYIHTAEGLQEKAKNLDQKLEEILKETKGDISYTMIVERLNSEFPFPVVSRSTIMHYVKSKKLTIKKNYRDGINPNLINPRIFYPKDAMKKKWEKEKEKNKIMQKKMQNTNNKTNNNDDASNENTATTVEPTTEHQENEYEQQQQELQLLLQEQHDNEHEQRRQVRQEQKARQRRQVRQEQEQHEHQHQHHQQVQNHHQQQGQQQVHYQQLKLQQQLQQQQQEQQRRRQVHRQQGYEESDGWFSGFESE